MTTIPRVLEALVTVCRTALPEARVDDGPTGELFEVDHGITTGVVVGYSENGAAVEVDVSREGGAGDDRETYRINCAIFVMSGDRSTVEIRTAAFDAYERVKGQLRTEHPIASGVLTARVDTLVFSLGSSSTGIEAELRFCILMNAFDR